MGRTALSWGLPDSAALCARSIHYHRIPPTYWRDRLLRVRALGLNSIEVCWCAQLLLACTQQCSQELCAPLLSSPTQWTL